MQSPLSVGVRACAAQLSPHSLSDHALPRGVTVHKFASADRELDARRASATVSVSRQLCSAATARVRLALSLNAASEPGRAGSLSIPGWAALVSCMFSHRIRPRRTYRWCGVVFAIIPLPTFVAVNDSATPAICGSDLAVPKLEIRVKFTIGMYLMAWGLMFNGYVNTYCWIVNETFQNYHLFNKYPYWSHKNFYF